MPKRTDVARFHNEEAAAYREYADQKSGHVRQQMADLAADHEAHADMARRGTYPAKLDD